MAKPKPLVQRRKQELSIPARLLLFHVTLPGGLTMVLAALLMEEDEWSRHDQLGR
jgi:hypothetical protein